MLNLRQRHTSHKSLKFQRRILIGRRMASNTSLQINIRLQMSKLLLQRIAKVQRIIRSLIRMRQGELQRLRSRASARSRRMTHTRVLRKMLTHRQFINNLRQRHPPHANTLKVVHRSQRRSIHVRSSRVQVTNRVRSIINRVQSTRITIRTIGHQRRILQRRITTLHTFRAHTLIPHMRSRRSHRHRRRHRPTTIRRLHRQHSRRRRLSNRRRSNRRSHRRPLTIMPRMRHRRSHDNSRHSHRHGTMDHQGVLKVPRCTRRSRHNHTRCPISSKGMRLTTNTHQVPRLGVKRPVRTNHL